MKLTTSDLEFKYKQIFEELENNGGDLTEELQEALAINESDLEERVDNYYGIISQNEGDIERLTIQMKKIKSKIDSKNKVNAYIKEILNKAIIASTVPTKTAAGYLTYKREFPNILLNLVSSPSVSVDITDMQKIAAAGLGKYTITVKTTDSEALKEIKEVLTDADVTSEFSPDKKEIGDKLKDKQIVEGAELFIKHNLSFK